LWVLALLALLLLSLVVCTGLAFAQPSLMKAVLSNFQSQPTVTITPASHVEQNSYGIQAVTGTPNAALHQVSARQVSYTTPAQHKTATATGHTQTPAVQATGTLTFFNGNTTAYTVGAGTVFTDAKGVRITNNASVVIPAGNPITGYGKVTATAHAVNGGTAGNIRANDFNLVPCCGSAAVLVSNTAAFTGGQDPQNYSFLQQSDIDSVANSLKTALTPQGQRGLQSQRRASEQPATAPACSPTVTADQPVGDTGKDIKSATVTVSVTCTQEVYDQQGAQTLAETLLKTKATTDLPGYALVGSLLTTIKQQSVDSKTNTVSLLATTKGTWVYQFSKAQQQALAKLIAGLTAAQAKAKLLSQPGVADVSIPADVGTFPSDPTQISIVIAQVTGFPAPGSTPTSGGPGGPGATAPAGSGTPQPGRGSNDGGSA
jgi:hypothetical protein